MYVFSFMSIADKQGLCSDNVTDSPRIDSLKNWDTWYGLGYHENSYALRQTTLFNRTFPSKKNTPSLQPHLSTSAVFFHFLKLGQRDYNLCDLTCSRIVIHLQPESEMGNDSVAEGARVSLLPAFMEHIRYLRLY